jgi:hypothetical protein
MLLSKLTNYQCSPRSRLNDLVLVLRIRFHLADELYKELFRFIKLLQIALQTLAEYVSISEIHVHQRYAIQHYENLAAEVKHTGGTDVMDLGLMVEGECMRDT